ncbi:NnrS family protein [Salinisphaera sp. LB1]|uniref:NnrS family protein n=1 Tax=Salinisphaera sp. LB1 TaxID=2183911 RepID=UPI000D706DA5|nr:NnrS family protein [Salinisphaera sp. LB1]
MAADRPRAITGEKRRLGSVYPNHALFSAPHRLFFLVGAIQLVASVLVWLIILIGLYTPAVPTLSLTVDGISAHSFLMLYGLFTFFVFGFLTTVFPRWLATEVIDPRRYVVIAILLAAGIAGYYLGLFTRRDIAFVGNMIFVAGWGLGLWTLVGIWRRSNHPDKRFALFPLTCATAGCAGAIVYALWLWTSRPELRQAAIAIGMWLYLVPLIVAVSHRMIPFFSARVLNDYTVVKPDWTLPATLLCVTVHCLLAIIGQPEWTVLADLPLALLAGWHSVRWGLVRSLHVPLLGMLHISFAWLPVAMGLYTAQRLLQLTDAPFDLGMAPLHALGIGFVTSMVVAMASRVSLGHSGRPLVADRIILWTFVIVQLTAITRVLAEIPLPGNGYAYLGLVLATAVLWLAAFIPWSLRFGAIYLRRRVDGAPG